MRRACYFLLMIFPLLVSMGCTSAPKGNAPPTNGTISQEPAKESTSIPSFELSTEDSTFLSKLSNAIAGVVEKVRPAVIFISAKVRRESIFGYFTTQIKTGSGVIIDPQGYAITNNHVVEGAYELEVKLPNVERSFEAEIVGTDEVTDLAVIKLEGQNFPTASFGDASLLRPGNLVIAIGNSLALEGGPTITLGVVSNTHRSFALGESTFYDAIQTDAAINPGNSGGSLVNMKGKVVGINTFIAREAQNIGFAISANTAKLIYSRLLKPPHRVIRPWLGVTLADIKPEVASQWKLFKRRGILIVYLKEGSPADEAGLREGDVITKFGAHEVTEVTQFLKVLWQEYKPGEKVNITFWRGRERKTTVIKLGERPV